MAINVQYGPQIVDYGEALAAASKNIEQNRRSLDQGKLALALKQQSDALRSQVVQRGVAGGGGSYIRSSDPTGVGNIGSNLSTASSFQLQQSPQQRSSSRQGSSGSGSSYSPGGGGGYQQPGSVNTQGKMIYNPTTPLSSLGSFGASYMPAYQPIKQSIVNPLTSAFSTLMGAFGQ